MTRIDSSSVYIDLDAAQLKVELQLENPEVAGANMVIDRGSACGKVEQVNPTIVVTAEFCIFDLLTYMDAILICFIYDKGCCVYEFSWSLKGVSEVGVLKRFPVMVKFKRSLDIRDVYGG